MNPKIKHSRDRAFKRFVYIFFFLMCACFVLPLIVVISASFTSEQALTSGGFSLLPRDFTLDAYKSAFSSGTRVLRAYGVTIFQAVVGTVLSSLVAALAAYPLSRSNFRYRRPITVFIFFTMLFSAGMIPNYIIFSKYFPKYLGILFNNACIRNYINDTILMIFYRMFQSKCKRGKCFSSSRWHCETKNPFFLFSLFYTIL